MVDQVTPDIPNSEKFALFDRNMRWELADLVRERNLAEANLSLPPARPRSTFYLRFGKRYVDIFVSSCALIVTLPINAIIAVITLCTLGPPLMFHQKRIGRHGEVFTLTKFRNMREAYDGNGHPLPGHLRVTRFGRFIRKTSMDELLNFWSIFKGDMSLIGPRPLLPEYLDRFTDRHNARHSVKPGLECPFHAPLDHPMTYDDQFENDIWYVENVSFRTDLFLLGRLVVTALDSRQAKVRAQSSRGAFMGYNPDGRVIDSHHVPGWAVDEILMRHHLVQPSNPLSGSLEFPQLSSGDSGDE